MRLPVRQFQIFLVLCAVTASVATSNPVRYDEHKLYMIRMEPEKESRIKRQIDRHITLDRSQSRQISNITVLVEPHETRAFESLLKNNNISHEVLNINVQRMIDEESKNVKPLNVSATDFEWNNFYHLETIYSWLDHLAEKHSDIITPLNIGTSYEGRPMKGVKLSHRNDNPAVFIEAGIHAKEWIGPAAATFILNQLLTSSDTNVQDIARNFNWIIFPVCNPDGYKYTFDVDRFWRKNREPFGTCFGVDLNRNWNSSWNSETTDEEVTDPCGNNYAGPYAFSAPETRNLQNYLRDNAQSQRIKTYLSFHAAAEKLLFPYAGKSTKPTNFYDLQRIGEQAIDALAKSNGTQFESGRTYQILYEASGTSMDWAYDELNIPIVFTYELRRSKFESANFQDRFLLPVDQIEPAGLETLDSVMALLNEARELSYYQRILPPHRPLAVIFYSIGLSALLIVILIIGLYYARKHRLCMRTRTADSDSRILMVYQA